jgi:hypothetical protein
MRGGCVAEALIAAIRKYVFDPRPVRRWDGHTAGTLALSR